MSSSVRKGSLAGSLVTAFMASVCCLGPLVFSLLGISGMGFLMKFEEYRSVFISVAITLLGIAGYFTYWKKSVRECSPDILCASSRADRLNKLSFWIAASLVLLMILYPTIEAHLGD